MTTFTGYILAGPSVSGATKTHPSAQGTTSGWLGAPHGRRTTFTSNRPAAVRSLSLTGSRQHSFFDDYYNRFHVLPGLLEYGSVTGIVTKVASIWNAYTTPNTLNSYTTSDTEGVQLVGRSLPAALKPLELISYGVQVTDAGPALFDGLFTFHASTSELLDLHLTGTRARTWTFPPNWSNPVTVTYAFKTNIITSRSGKEQRRALRLTPRKTFEFTSLVYDDQYRAFNRLLVKWQGKPLMMPDYTRSAEILRLNGDGTITLTGATPDWHQVGTVVLINDDQYVIATVNPLSLETPISAVPAGTLIRPGLSGLLSPQLSVTTPTNIVATTDITFDVTPGFEPATSSEWPLEIFDGRPVFTLRPNWGQSVSSDWSRQIEQVDTGRGRIATYRPTAFGTRIQKATFLRVGYSEAEYLRLAFDRAKGQQGEFWMPTWDQDLPLMSIGADTITVAGVETFNDYHDSTVHRAVCIRLNDGRQIYRKVQTMFISGVENTGIQFTQPFLFDIALTDVSEVSWLLLRRFASDNLTVEWITDTVARSAVSIRSLEALAPEGDYPVYDGAAQWLWEAWNADTTAFDLLNVIVNERYPGITL